MKEPPAYLHDILYDLERTVLTLWAEYPALNDKDVEYVYSKLKDYFKKRSQGKDLDEPDSTFERREALIDELLNLLDSREESGADEHLLNDPEKQPAGYVIRSLPALYAICFNRLHESVRFWSKNGGYLQFIRQYVL